MVDNLQLMLFGKSTHDTGFADTGIGLNEWNQTGQDDLGQHTTELPGSAGIEIIHFLSFSWLVAVDW